MRCIDQPEVLRNHVRQYRDRLRQLSGMRARVRGGPNVQEDQQRRRHARGVHLCRDDLAMPEVPVASVSHRQ
jgi:hypothetical protein